MREIRVMMEMEIQRTKRLDEKVREMTMPKINKSKTLQEGQAKLQSE